MRNIKLFENFRHLNESTAASAINKLKRDFEKSVIAQMAEQMKKDFMQLFDKHPDLDALIYNFDPAEQPGGDSYIATVEVVTKDGEVGESLEEWLPADKWKKKYDYPMVEALRGKSIRLDRNGKTSVVKTEY